MFIPISSLLFLFLFDRQSQTAAWFLPPAGRARKFVGLAKALHYTATQKKVGCSNRAGDSNAAI